MPSGLFFVSIALFQLVWARLVLARTTVPALAAGILLNVGAVALWVLSRTSGTPFAPTPENLNSSEPPTSVLCCFKFMSSWQLAGWYSEASMENRYQRSGTRSSSSVQGWSSLWHRR
jgi:hypothetical protein